MMGLLGQLVAALGLAPIATAIAAYFRYRAILAKERHRTVRITAALQDTAPEHRASIIEACGSLEPQAKASRRWWPGPRM